MKLSASGGKSALFQPDDLEEAVRKDRQDIGRRKIAAALGPGDDAMDSEGGGPADVTHQRRHRHLDRALQTGAVAELACEDDLAARTQHPGAFVERPFGLGDERDDEGQADRIERPVGKGSACASMTSSACTCNRFSRLVFSRARAIMCSEISMPVTRQRRG